MITSIAHHNWALIIAWVLVFAVPASVLIGLVIWPSPHDHARSVEGIRLRLERERAAAFTVRSRQVGGAGTGRSRHGG